VCVCVYIYIYIYIYIQGIDYVNISVQMPGFASSCVPANRQESVLHSVLTKFENTIKKCILDGAFYSNYLDLVLDLTVYQIRPLPLQDTLLK
jgi:hypothetical protein